MKVGLKATNIGLTNDMISEMFGVLTKEGRENHGLLSGPAGKLPSEQSPLRSPMSPSKGPAGKGAWEPLCLLLLPAGQDTHLPLPSVSIRDHPPSLLSLSALTPHAISSSSLPLPLRHPSFPTNPLGNVQPPLPLAREDFLLPTRDVRSLRLSHEAVHSTRPASTGPRYRDRYDP